MLALNQPVVGAWSTTHQQKMLKKIQIKKFKITFLGIILKKNDKAKCDSESNNEECFSCIQIRVTLLQLHLPFHKDVEFIFEARNFEFIVL